MYRLGRLIFLTTPGFYIHCTDVHVVFEQDGQPKRNIMYRDLESIVVFHDRTTLSAYVMRKCAENGIAIHYVSTYGKYLGSFVGYDKTNVMLRKLQFQMIDSQKGFRYVQCLLQAKLKNSVRLLKYYGHHAPNKEHINEVCKYLKDSTEKLKTAVDINDLRMIEMNAAREYYSTFDGLIKSKDEDMKYEKRSHHPGLNNFNVLLNFFYVLLTGQCDAALTVMGLDSECGILHTLKSGRYSLACDLVEEFRAMIVDKFVIKIVNLGKVKSNDFTSESGEIRLTDDARKKLLIEWDNWLHNEKLFSVYWNKNLSAGVMIYEQARLLAQYVRGDIEDYTAFFSRLY